MAGAELLFLTRHPPTAEQCRVAARLGLGALAVRDVRFTDDPVADLLHLGVSPPATLAIVAPLHVGLALLRAGFTIVEFANDSTARARGDYACSGAWVHSAAGSHFIPSDPSELVKTS